LRGRRPQSQLPSFADESLMEPSAATAVV